MSFVLWLYEQAQSTIALFIMVPILAVSVSGTVLLRRFMPHSWSSSRDAIGVCVSAVGVIYAVLLAMIAVAAWNNYSDLETKVATEASLANNLFRDVEGLSPDESHLLRRLLREYVGVVYCEEFPQLREARLDVRDPPTRKVAGEMMTAWTHIKPRDMGESNVHSETLRVVNQMFSMRRERMLAADAQLLTVLWIVVLAGGLVTVALTWLTVVEDLRLNVILNGAYGLMVGLMIFCIFQLDHPFWGRVSVDATPFEYVGRSLEGLDATLGVRDCLSQPR